MGKETKIGALNSSSNKKKWLDQIRGRDFNFPKLESPPSDKYYQHFTECAFILSALTFDEAIPLFADECCGLVLLVGREEGEDILQHFFR